MIKPTPVSLWLLGHWSREQWVHDISSPCKEMGQESQMWQRYRDITSLNKSYLSWLQTIPDDALSNCNILIFKVSFSDNIRVKSLVWKHVFTKIQTETSGASLNHQISDNCRHTKHSESHCGSVEHSVLWPALQMDRHTVVLLCKEQTKNEGI